MEGEILADYMHLYCQQVTKVIPKPAKKIMKSAMESAKIAWIKAHKKKSKMTLSAAEAKLPEPPAGTSTARRLQNPGHVDIVKALVKVPSIQEMGLKKEGEQLYSKMMEATTRGLSASSGGKYFRYVCTYKYTYTGTQEVQGKYLQKTVLRIRVHVHGHVHGHV